MDFDLDFLLLDRFRSLIIFFTKTEKKYFPTINFVITRKNYTCYKNICKKLYI